MMATRHHISWDTNTKQLKFTTPTPEAKSRKRTAGTSDGTNKEKDGVVDMQGNDDRVRDGTHHQPPPEKTMRSNASNKAAIVFPHAAVELQSRGRPRKNHLPSRVPDAALGEAAKYRGVYWDHNLQKFRAQLRHNSKQLYVGSSADAKEAAFMRDRAWRDLGKDLSKLNFDDTVPIPKKYLASVAKASKMVASKLATLAAVVQQTAQSSDS